MGMAASQARLLSITSRLHDAEYKAQNLQNAKLQLATQQDAAYEEYLKALDQRTLTFASIDASGHRSDLTATFNNLFSVNAANTATGDFYALIDSRGRVVVSDDVEEGYDRFTHNNSDYVQNANLFALYMLYGDEFESNDELFNQIADEVLNEKIGTDTHLADLYAAATGRSDNGGGLHNNNNNGNSGGGNQGGSGGGSQGSNGTGYHQGTGTGNGTTHSGTGTGSATVLVSGKEPVIPDPVPPKPIPTLSNTQVTPSQTKPQQRGGNDGGKGGRGVSGTDIPDSSLKSENTGMDAAASVTNTTNTTSVHVGKVPIDDYTLPQAAQQPQAEQPSQTDQSSQVDQQTDIPTTPVDSPVVNPPFTPRNQPDLRAGEASLSEIYNSSNPEKAQQFLNYFFNKYRTNIFNNTQLNASDLPNFDYYVRMFNAIQQHGGCISINDFNGPDGSAANNSEWLTAMLESGQFSLEIFNTDAQGNVTLSGAGVDSDSNLCYSTTTQIDKRAMAKAEAAYEHAMKVIDRKEKKIDNELNKIETERNALTKEYDSVKKVADDNIERTFGIFS